MESKVHVAIPTCPHQKSLPLMCILIRYNGSRLVDPEGSLQAIHRWPIALIRVLISRYFQGKSKDGAPVPEYGAWHKAAKVDRYDTRHDSGLNINLYYSFRV
jgi:hypothetical protein